MKKIVSLVAVLISLHAIGQTEKGAFLVGGGLNLKTGKNTSQFALTPNFGYFFADNFVAGANLNTSFAKSGSVKANEFGLGPFARYYFGKTTTKPFAVTEFNFLNSKTTSGNTEFKNNGWGFLFGLGFAAFINQTVAVEGISGYNYSKFKDADGSGGFSLRFGFQIYLNNKNVTELKSNVLGK
jgi:hypothetical protein